MYAFIKPLIHRIPPETAHRLGIEALRRGLLPETRSVESPVLAVKLFGLDFPNPVGLAAGFDKNAEVYSAVLKQGFGFVETGTVTPQPQAGNPRPRIFRLPEEEAVINRLGFNNLGLSAYVANLSRRDKTQGVIGANIGKNKDAADATADYTQGLMAVYPHADYVTVNISSPNTPGLRALQKREALAELLAALRETREGCARAHKRTVPLLLKVAPDLETQEKEDIAQLVQEYAIDGLIVSNTTVSRPEGLKGLRAGEQGGLSGRPLFALSTACLKDFYRLTEGKLPIVGVGGIASAQDAYTKIRAGASLVQLYTALVYQGFGLVRAIQEGLVELLKRDGLLHISDAVGADDR